jgi:hypothetical protein
MNTLLSMRYCCSAWRSCEKIQTTAFRQFTTTRLTAEENAAVQIKPNSPERLQQLKAQVFGDTFHPDPSTRTGEKYLQTELMAEEIASYWMPSIEFWPQMKTTEWKDLTKLRHYHKLMEMRRRGKGPPERGKTVEAMIRVVLGVHWTGLTRLLYST